MNRIRQQDLQGRRSRSTGRLFRTLLVTVLFLTIGCDSEESPSAEGGGQSKTRPVAVRVAPVTKGPINLRFEFVGEVEARKAVSIAAPAPGKVLKVDVEMGQIVSEGELLVLLDAAEIRAELAEAQAALAVSRAGVQRAEAELQSVTSELSRKAPLAEERLVTPQEMDQLNARHDAARAALEVTRAQTTQSGAAIGVLKQHLVDTRLTAPFSGRIEERLLDPGSIVAAGAPILRLVHTDPAVVRFQVSEQQVGRLREAAAKVGSSLDAIVVHLTLAAYPGRSWQGKLVRLAPTLDRQSRSAAAEAEFNNEANELMPGMYCRLSTDLGGRDDALLIPLKAIIRGRSDGDEASGRDENTGHGPLETVVFVLQDGQRVARRPITLGVTEGTLGEVLAGLELGDEVIVEGQHALSDGRPVKVVGGREKAGRTRVGAEENRDSGRLASP